MFISSEITLALRQMTFETFNLDGRSEEIKEMRQVALEYLASYPDGWMVLLGNSGCGKTHLSMAVMSCMLSRDVQCLYFQHVDGMKELKGMLRRDDDSINKRINQMQRVPLLVWDDLWKRKQGVEPTPFEFETVYDVLNYRWLNLLPTIISSERSPAQLVEIDEAIGSRIIERGRGHLYTIAGRVNNYRLRG